MTETNEPLAAEEPRGALRRARAPFLAALPADRTLEPFIELFEAGNFRELRRRAADVDAGSLDPEIQRAIAELVSRTEPDPALKWMLLICFALLAFTVGWVYLH